MKDQAMTQTYFEMYGFEAPEAKPFSPREMFNKFNQRRCLVRSRRQLGNLDQRLLADVGLTPEQAEAEASLPFWKG